MQIPESQRKTEQKGAERRLSGAGVCRSGVEGPEGPERNGGIPRLQKVGVERIFVPFSGGTEGAAYWTEHRKIGGKSSD